MTRLLRWLFRIEAYNKEQDDLVKRIADMDAWLKERRIGNPIEEDRFPRRQPELRG